MRVLLCYSNDFVLQIPAKLAKSLFPSSYKILLQPELSKGYTVFFFLMSSYFCLLQQRVEGAERLDGA